MERCTAKKFLVVFELYETVAVNLFRRFYCHNISDQEVSASAVCIPHRRTECELFIPRFVFHVIIL